VFSCKHQQSTTKSSDSSSKISSSSKKKYAEKLGVSESDIKNEKLYQFINDWYGVKYKYGGKDKSGIDCSGLTAALYLAVYKKTISSNT
jgi:cell wall-associated NlpC family hydrolase